MWSDAEFPELPTIELFDGERIPHPYLRYVRKGALIIHSPLFTLGRPRERPYEERLQECLERGVTLAQRIREFVSSSEDNAS